MSHEPREAQAVDEFRQKLHRVPVAPVFVAEGFYQRVVHVSERVVRLSAAVDARGDPEDEPVLVKRAQVGSHQRVASAYARVRQSFRLRRDAREQSGGRVVAVLIVQARPRVRRREADDAVQRLDDARVVRSRGRARRGPAERRLRARSKDGVAPAFEAGAFADVSERRPDPGFRDDSSERLGCL